MRGIQMLAIIGVAFSILLINGCANKKERAKELLEREIIANIFQGDTILDNNTPITIYEDKKSTSELEALQVSAADKNSIEYVIFSASFFGISEVMNTNSALLIADKDSINLLKDLFINNDLISLCPCGYNYRIQFFDKNGNSVWCEMYYPLNQYSHDDDKIKKIVSDLSTQMYKHPTHYIYNIEVNKDIAEAKKILKDNGFRPFVMEERLSQDNKASFQILAGKNSKVLKYNLRKFPFVLKVEKALNSLDIDGNNSNTLISPNRVQGISPFATVEQMPQFEGGEDEMYNFIEKNLKYPKSVLDVDIRGRVIIRFVVTAEGDVIKAKILRGIHPDFDKEALRVVEMMPKWIPGKQNGVEVPVYFTIPIVFKLSDKQD